MSRYNGVNLRANGDYWQAYWYGPDGRIVSRGLGPRRLTSRPQARRRCAEIEAELAQNPSMRAGRHKTTLGHWLDRYRAMRTDLAPTSVALLRETEAYLLRFFGADRQLDRITRADASEFRAWLQTPARSSRNVAVWPSAGRGLSDASTCKHVRICRAMFGERFGAMKLDLIPLNPFDRERGTPQQRQAEWPLVSDEQIQRLIDAAPGPGWRAMIGLCAYAGLRRGEALRLRWCDIQWERHRLVVVAKDGATSTKSRRRETFMEPTLERLLLDVRESTAGELVADIGPNNLQRDAVAMMRRAGLSWPKPFHTLRKSRATTWRAIYPEHVVDAWLGHGPEVARQHYTQVAEEFYDPSHADRLRIIESLRGLTPDQLAEVRGEISRIAHKARTKFTDQPTALA